MNIGIVPTKQWGQKKAKHAHGALNNACGAFDEVDYTVYTAVAGKTTGRQLLSLPVIAPLSPKLTSSRRSRIHCS